MQAYYFDIETYTTGDKPDPTKDEIITAQYQQMDVETGETLGGLTILKDWDTEFSEKRIVEELYEKLFEDLDYWHFVPVGFNLWFEWRFLQEKFKKYLDKRLDLSRFDRPQIDLKPIAVLMNNGRFVGSGLDKFTNKLGSGAMIKELYDNEKYSKIEEYIMVEAEEFLNLYRDVLGNLSKFGRGIKSQLQK